MAKRIAIKKSEQEKLHRDLLAIYNKMCQHMDNFYANAKFVNNYVWYGGKDANKQYQRVKTTYENNVKAMRYFFNTIWAIDRLLDKSKRL